MAKSTHLFLVAALVSSLAACSSTPKPKAEIALTNSALRNAEISGAREYAPIELRTAREKKELADKAVADEEYGRAKRLSAQARVDAELAQAKAEAEKSRLALKEVQDSILLMRQEVSRAGAR
jgi:predicted S18 family serine protease